MAALKNIENHMKIQKLLIYANKHVRQNFVKDWEKNFGEKWVDKELSSNFTQFRETLSDTLTFNYKKKLMDGNSWIGT